MKTLLRCFVLLIFISINSVFAKGKLFIVGGGTINEKLVKEYVELAGGDKGKFLIVPFASENPLQSAISFSIKLKSIGINNYQFLLGTKETIDSDSNFAKLNGITAVFFTGGDQSKLTKVLLNSNLLEKIKSMYKHGCVIGGTSAGAAVMSKAMITGNELVNKDSSNSFNSITKDNIEISEGFGFLDNAIVDQHFLKRKRLNRLFSIVLQNKKLIGIGIDEATAIIVDGKKFRVVGESLVTVIDASRSTGFSVNKSNHQAARKIRVDLLKEGDKYQFISK